MEENEAYAMLQKKLAQRVNIPLDGGYQPRDGDVVLGLDIQYVGDDAHVAGDVYRFHGEHLGTYAGVATCNTPYWPSYFCFREGPPLLAFMARLTKESIPKPNLIVVDGHGIAHPRKFGVACWLGIATETPTMGSAKDSLLPYEGELGHARGSTVKVLLDKEVVGYVLRTQDGVKPIFISPGHLLSLDTCAIAALALADSFRIPEPLRNADHAARSRAKGLHEPMWKDWGMLASVVPPWEKS